MATITKPIMASLGASKTGKGSAGDGTLGYTVLSAAGATLVARTTAGITEVGTSGIYRASVASWDTSWTGFILWDSPSGTYLASESFDALPPTVAEIAAAVAAVVPAPTQVRVGGGRLSPVASGLDGQMTSFVSDVLPLRLDLIGQDGQAIPHNGATLTGTLTNAAGTVQASAVAISTTDLNTGEGELLATVTLPATAGTYQLTITRNAASATDVQTFGPFAIKAGRK